MKKSQTGLYDKLFMINGLSFYTLMLTLDFGTYQTGCIPHVVSETTGGLYTNNGVVVVVVVVSLSYSALYRTQFLTQTFYLWYIDVHWS